MTVEERHEQYIVHLINKEKAQTQPARKQTLH